MHSALMHSALRSARALLARPTAAQGPACAPYAPSVGCPAGSCCVMQWMLPAAVGEAQQTVTPRQTQRRARYPRKDRTPVHHRHSSAADGPLG
jgi:hypothetical protein